MRVVGVDPGGRWTGLVLRVGGELHGTALVERRGAGAWAGYLDDVVAAFDGLMAADVDLVAVEGVRAPSPHLGQTNPAGVIDTARVLGWVEVASPVQVVEVAPAGHGSAPLRVYPQALVGARERAGTGRFRHLRSAWDVAGAAMVLAGAGGGS